MSEEPTVTITDYTSQWKKVLKQSFKRELAEYRREFPHKTSLYLDVRRLFDNELFKQVLETPKVAIGYIKDALVQNGLLHLDNPSDYDEVQIRFAHLPRKTQIRDLRAGDVGTLVTLEGVVRTVSEVKPKLKVGMYRCRNCGRLVRAPQSVTAVKLSPPNSCTGCDKTSSRNFKLQESGHEFVDCQVITLQEFHETMRAGESPQSIDVLLIGDITGSVTAGSRVVLNGILQTVPGTRENPVFDVFLEGMSIESEQVDPNAVELTDEDYEQIQAYAADPNIYSKLAASIAPTIYGNETVKLAIALQLFGGVRKDIGGTHLRGDIHILLIGDPSVAKSQMLVSAVNLSARGIMASGKSSTTAGLTATATRDDSRLGGGKWILEAGALVLADGGLAAVDELDKMGESDRSAMHQALEQQVVPVNKAGINTVLRTRCSLLAAANPKLGRFDDYQPITDQIDLSPTLLSRFDLIFVLRDKPESARDESIATHILRTHLIGGKIRANANTDGRDEVEPTIPKDLLKKYIAYARRSCSPILSEEANEALKAYYLDLRKRAGDMAAVPATARQLEALVRLSEASARVRLSPVVELEDAEIVIALVDDCLRQVAYDKVSGSFDIDKMCGRTSRTQRNIVTVLTTIIREFTDAETGVAQLSQVIGEAMSRGLSDAEIHDALEVMRRNTLIIEPTRNRTVKLI